MQAEMAEEPEVADEEALEEHVADVQMEEVYGEEPDEDAELVVDEEA